MSLGIGMAPVIAIPYGARVFSIPPPGVNREGLVELVTTRLGPRAASATWSYPDFVDLRDAETGIALTGWAGGESTTTIQTPRGVRTDSVPTLFVSANYFSTIGVALARGPGFGAAAEPVVIVGHNFWQNRQGSDPDIIGKTLTLDGIPHVIVGIAPDQFDGHLGFQGRDLFVPLERHPLLVADKNVRFDRANDWVHIHGRLSPGVGISQASAAVSAVTSQLARQYPATNAFKAGIVEAYYATGNLQRPDLAIIQTVGLTLTGLVLLVVCLNISGMMQVRSVLRERELSIRQAIGATRGRLIRYLLSEAVVLAGLGATLASIVLFTIPSVMSWDRGTDPVSVTAGAESRPVHRRDLCRALPGGKSGVRTAAGSSFQSSRDPLLAEGRCWRGRAQGRPCSSRDGCPAGCDRGSLAGHGRHFT
ncbi:MAG: ABC transporter permease [Vicinamibacterales bacterium]